MARTVEQIQQGIINTLMADGITVTGSTTSVRRIWTYAIAYAIWLLEKLQDLFKTEVQEQIDSQEPGTVRWYVKKAKEYQHGFSLVPGWDYYDNTGISATVVAASKIVKFAALTTEPRPRMKVAKVVGGVLTKLSPAELAGFKPYMKTIKYAGMKLTDARITSTDPDQLYLQVRFKYNPLVLNAAGARIDGTDPRPALTALNNYLANISTTNFNGLFSVQKLVDELQAVEGIEDLKVDSIMTKFGLLPFTSVDMDFLPDAGWLVIDALNFVDSYITI